MKIVYILSSCKMGGASISFLNLVTEISKNNEVLVIYPNIFSPNNELVERLLNLGCKCLPSIIVYSTIPNDYPFYKKILRVLRIVLLKTVSFLKIRKIIKRFSPDVIHTNSGVVHEGYFVSKVLNIPHVWHLREYQTLDFNWKIFPSYNRFVSMLKKTYTVCITKDIQKYFNISNCTKSHVYYNPIMSIETANSINLIRENFFLVASRISKEKGIESVIKNFAVFSKDNPEFILKVAGEGDPVYLSELKKLCENLNVTEKIEFLGFTKDVYSYMLRAKALLVGSYNEGFGRMTAEANMLGCIVIGRNSAGTKEIIDETKGGYLFDTDEDLLECLNKVSRMSNDEISSFMNEPKKRAITLYSSEQHVSNMENLYLKLRKTNEKYN